MAALLLATDATDHRSERVRAAERSALERSLERQVGAPTWTTDPADPGIVATVLVDHDTALAPDALAAIDRVLRHHPEIDAVFFDGVVAGRHRRRPAWSPLRLLSHPGDLDLVAARGVHRGGDLARRIAALTSTEPDRIAHVPHALTARSGEVEVGPAASTALQEFAARQIPGAVLEPLRTGRCAITPHGAPPPMSVVIPTAGTRDDTGRRLVSQAIDAVRLEGVDVEILLVVGDEFDGDPDELLGPSTRLVHRPSGPWNFSAAVNAGILAARHDRVLVLNDDVERLDVGWLARLAVHLQDPTVGAVGALLVFPDHTTQHVGMVIDDAYPLHMFVGRTVAELADDDADLARDVVAVTAACVLARRADLLAVGGFTTTLPHGFNDVDLCLKLHRHGLRTVIEPAARLVHHESASRPPVTERWEWDTFISRWGEVTDPWYHPGHFRPDDPADRRRNADHLEPPAPFRDDTPRTAAVRSGRARSRLQPAPAARPAAG